MDELRKQNKQLSRNRNLLWKRHVEKFSEWLREKIPIDGDFSKEEDAHDFSEDDDIVPNSYSRGNRENPSSNESHKSKKTGGSTKSKSFKKVDKRSRTKRNSSHDLSDKDLDDEDYCNDEDGSKTTTNRAKFKGPLTEKESEGDSSDEGDAIDSDAELESSNPSSKESHLSSKTLGGENSEQFSSHLGNIASQMVPLTFSDWRVIKKGYKDLYWQSVLQKFILDEGRRTYALQQIGRLWRAHKSRLRGKIRVYRKKKKDIARLQPEDCDDAKWEMFVKQMSKRKFILKSQKFQEIREKQDLPHTCSRQGYARLEFQMQKESLNPSSITRVDVWCKGHTKKNGKPSNSRVGERMDESQQVVTEQVIQSTIAPITSLSQVKAQSHSLVVWGNRNGWGFPFAFAKEQKVSRYP
ncbi:hypothetical protein IFM89_006692 [Coptis chinensis]|uniref:Uncharacterized protein n=1 Tax=Coptis chinensis TaxID=261450 RepID=A0A835M971_9MAGN|nr:hypothetical protein IFM89_006692 [Coptis chinensis]